MKHTSLVLVILDGFGQSPVTEGNAIHHAHTPFFDMLEKEYPHSLINASGEAMGLPKGQIGSSEVGHMTIGAGKIIEHDFVRIANAISEQSLETDETIQSLARKIREKNSALHICGLVSPGGVHSHSDHLKELILVFKKLGLTKIFIHAFTDGRDSSPSSADEYLKDLEHFLSEHGIGQIATIVGRYYAMDRDNNHDRTTHAEGALFGMQGLEHGTKPASEVVFELYDQGHTDEFFPACVFGDGAGRIKNGDGVFFFNFRSDRMRQLVQNILTRCTGEDIEIVTMTEYDQKFTDAKVVFPKLQLTETLSSVISKAGLSQVHIAETEKYAHVTYFLGGGREVQHPNEEFVLVDSNKVATHDQLPEMKAKEITDIAIQKLDTTDVIIINYANADIVGHTGNYDAAIKAIETLDTELKRLYDGCVAKGAVMVITADHGNAEHMHLDGQPHTAHTTNPVPLYITKKNIHLKNGGLHNITPTVLSLLGIEKPEGMTGKSLLVNQKATGEAYHQ